MADITTLLTRIRTMLQDPPGQFWGDAELESAIESALELINAAAPLEDTLTLAVETSGRDLPLANIPALRRVTEAWWPYDSARPGGEQPANQVRGWRLVYRSRAPYLRITTTTGRPQPGDEVRIGVTCGHTVEGLAGAAATSLPTALESLLAAGAAGLAASSAVIDHSLPVPWEQAAKWAGTWLALFDQGLERLARSGSRSLGEPWGPGWILDGWDRQ